MRLNIVLLAAAAALALWWYPQLPDRVATHFGFSGEADGWMSKDGFYVFYAVLMLSMFGMFSGLVVLLRRFPTSMINIPNREYWFAPERREAGFAKLEKNMHHMGSATLAFMMFMMDVSFRANLASPPHLVSYVWMYLAGYLIVLGWLIARLYRDFRIEH
jgi:uncharacterized membrane protein